MRRYNYRYIANYTNENGTEEILPLFDISSRTEAERIAKDYGNRMGLTYISITLDCW